MSLATRLALPVCLLAPLTAQTPPEPTPDELPIAGGGTLAVERFTVRVPERRDLPDARSIELAVLRVPALEPTDRAPLYYLAGGPGASSIDLVTGHLKGGGRGYLQLVGRDIIAIDQRGVGASRPNLETDTRWNLPVDVPGSRAAHLEILRERSREEARRFRERGVDLAGYTTVESADDIDAVRRALGHDEIALWGASYGTHLALATLRRHPTIVERAVLIAPEGPDHTLKLPSASQRVLERVDVLLREDPSKAEAYPEFVSQLARVLEELANEPVFVEIDGTRVGISRFDVQQLLAHAIGFAHEGLPRVPLTVAEMASGNFAAVGREILRERREATIGSAMRMVMDSASGVSEERARLIAEQAPHCLLGDAVNFPFPDLREAWGAPDLGASFRGPVHSDVPVLFLVGDLDSRTPLANVRELMRHLPNAHRIVVENAAHDLNWVQKELREAWSAFLHGKAVEVERVRARPVQFELPR